MDASRLPRTGDPRILAWTTLLAGLALVGSLALVPTASSATVTSAWQAKIGSRGANGTAKVQVFNTGTGSLTLRLAKMRPATLFPVVLHKGTCSAVGPVLARLDSIRSSNAGAANRTTSLTVTRVRAILAATRSGKVAIRIGSGSALRCGVFSALPIATPQPSPSASPTPSISPTPSPSRDDPLFGGTLFVGTYFAFAVPAHWSVVSTSNPDDVLFQLPGVALVGASFAQSSQTLEQLSATVISNIMNEPGEELEQTEAITMDGAPARMLTYRAIRWPSIPPLHSLDAFCVHNGRAYELVFTDLRLKSAGGTPIDPSDRTLFLHILASFHFLSAAG
jgi:hypothetical protein